MLTNKCPKTSVIKKIILFSSTDYVGWCWGDRAAFLALIQVPGSSHLVFPPSSLASALQTSSWQEKEQVDEHVEGVLSQSWKLVTWPNLIAREAWKRGPLACPGTSGEWIWQTASRIRHIHGHDYWILCFSRTVLSLVQITYQTISNKYKICLYSLKSLWKWISQLVGCPSQCLKIFEGSFISMYNSPNIRNHKGNLISLCP